MFIRSLGLGLLTVLAVLSGEVRADPSISPSPSITWGTWDESAFAMATKAKKLVLLDLEAVWCHWCHVMEQQTYSDPAIIELIQRHYIPIRVDQAERPDLATRYEDYGWPATVILSPAGKDLWKEAGFIEPADFAAVLKKFSASGLQQPDVEVPRQKVQAVNGNLTDALRSELSDQHYKSLDTTIGGLERSHRYLRPDSLEFALLRAAEGNQADSAWAKLTLNAGLKLIDPTWGGMYQYSTHSDWDHPHFEKIMFAQAKSLSLYAQGFALFGDDAYSKAAQSIRGYVKNFLTSPEGAFYASQDADLIKGQHSGDYFALGDSERRARGVPEVQKRIYSRENGWMIEALADLYSATGDETAISDAVVAAKFVLASRSIPEGGFRHTENDPAGPYLADNLAMLRAFLALYRATADRQWIGAATSTAKFIASHFIDGELDKAVGIRSVSVRAGDAAGGLLSIDDNVDAARALNLLFRYTGLVEGQKLSLAALRYLSQPDTVREYSTQPGILLADLEISKEPLHITVVAHKDEPKGKELFAAALRVFSLYKRAEWWDKREGPLPHLDVTYPELSRPAAFLCSSQRCSLPIFEISKLATTVQNFTQKQK